MVFHAAHFLLTWVLLVSASAAKSRRQAPPLAVEARFKERITTKLQASLSAATKHLAWMLGVGEASKDSGTVGVVPRTFGRYELELTGVGHWRTSCEMDIDIARDSTTLCVLHKLQALTALCEVKGAAVGYRAGLLTLLRQLVGKRDTVVPGLGVKRALLPIATGLEAWFYEKTPMSGEYDISVAVQAAAMLALVQCGHALGEKELFSDIQSWFVAIERVYPRNAWDKMTFHANSILLESFVVISAIVQRESTFAEDIRSFVSDFEAYLRASFAQDPKAWSFSAAHAAVLSWSAERRTARKRRLGRTVDEYLLRWGTLAPNLNASSSYTCGPLQGLAPLLQRRGDGAAELLASALRLAEKDVDLFQLQPETTSAEATSANEGGDAEAARASPSPAAVRLGTQLLTSQGARLEGAFLRDEAQLQREGRRSLRIDDTAQCVLGIARMLQLVEGLAGVEVPQHAEVAVDQDDAPTDGEL